MSSRDQQPGDEEMILVKSAMENGEYVPCFEMPLDDGNRVRLLGDESILQLAQHIMEVSTWAEFDSLVFKQLSEAVESDGAVVLLGQLREQRGFGKHPSPLPNVHFTPGITAEGIPFLNVVVNGMPEGQIDIDPGRLLAMHLEHSIPWAKLDSEYYRYLTEVMDIDKDPARFMVSVLPKTVPTN